MLLRDELLEKCLLATLVRRYQLFNGSNQWLTGHYPFRYRRARR